MKPLNQQEHLQLHLLHCPHGGTHLPGMRSKPTEDRTVAILKKHAIRVSQGKVSVGSGKDPGHC